MRNFFLADDDSDDRELFEDALMEISDTTVRLTKAVDGKDLMVKLADNYPPPPDVIFLDINMPFKNGFECLKEIRETESFKGIPVIIYSTSCEEEFINKVYKQGADYYICKPSNYATLRSVLFKALTIDWQNHPGQPSREQFILS